MIIDYGISTVGKSHIKKGTCCQDSHYIKKLQNGWYIAAVADGVGSAKNSHIGSKIAAETVVEFCDECMPWDYNVISIKSMMRTAYNYAYKQILRESEQSGEPIESYDTTLSMVIYDGQRIIYGHSGDGAIFGLTTFGDYVEITRPQKSTDGVSVIPLRGGYTQWVIDTYEEDLAAVLLMTDGMLETLCHYLLRDHERKANKAYVPLASYFADPYGFSEEKIDCVRKLIAKFVIADESYNADEFYERLLSIYKKRASDAADEIIDTLKKSNYPVNLMQAEQDDKTIVGLINTDLLVDDKEADFYSEPNWAELQEAWNRKAYPHLYAKKEDGEAGSDSDQKTETAENDDAQNSGASTVKSDAPSQTTDHTKKASEDDAFDDVLLIFEKRETPPKNNNVPETSSAGGPTTAPPRGATAPTATKEPEPQAKPKHEKPRKKGILGKIEDLFD
ncbi:protein phosphatase 2C domain-containing protein [Murdochiella massiliensis]|uniref:protein phosphatase 2C domain-containing protein n=1 Tax=Murdochiella massiliensis TaxID=1673723 RepID=UPI00082B25E3|nr:protein phosphatase 2C domain-containing protein [Murdochiella massiliensis]